MWNGHAANENEVGIRDNTRDGTLDDIGRGRCGTGRRASPWAAVCAGGDDWAAGGGKA